MACFRSGLGRYPLGQFVYDKIRLDGQGRRKRAFSNINVKLNARIFRVCVLRNKLNQPSKISNGENLFKSSPLGGGILHTTLLRLVPHMNQRYCMSNEGDIKPVCATRDFFCGLFPDEIFVENV